MPFAPVDLFARVVAPDAAALGRLDRLAIQDCGARLRVFADPLADLGPQSGMKTIPGAVIAPAAKVIVDGLPRRILVGE